MSNYREIMEKKLGRKLKSTEVVHHADGDKYNDLPDNLYLVKSRSNHAKIPKKKHIIKKEQIISLLEQTKYLEIASFHNALKQLFTPYQIELIIKKSKKETLSKTDREVFSRIVRKKLFALANEQLFQIAQRIAHE